MAYLFWYETSLNFDSFRGTNHTVSCFFIIIFIIILLFVYHHFSALRSSFFMFIFIWTPPRDLSIVLISLEYSLFLLWKLFLWSSFRKSHSICWKNSDIAKFGPKNWLFWEFLTYNFSTQLRIFLIFGMELHWILTLSGEPIILCLVGMETTHVVFFEKIIVYMPGKF